MANSLSVTNQIVNNTLSHASQLDAAASSIETFFETTKVNEDNIQSGSLSTVNIADSAITTNLITDFTLTQDKFDTSVTMQFCPVGSINAWANATPPAGWFICDGSMIDRTLYSSLFTAIGTAYGSGNGVTTFNIPDARGYFLRGTDSGQGRDPDAASRTVNNTGGASGDNVGSYQADAYTNHSHAYTPNNAAIAGSGAGTWGFGGIVGESTASQPSLNTSGGNETRPINAYVYFIIKY